MGQPPTVSLACLLSVEKLLPENKFNQRSEKNTEAKAHKQDQIIIVSSLNKVSDYTSTSRTTRAILSQVLRAVS